MRLSSEICTQVAKSAGQADLWSKIGTDATVDVSDVKMSVGLKDGHKFTIERKGHSDYKLTGDIAPGATKGGCIAFGKKAIQGVRGLVRGTVKILKEVPKWNDKKIKEVLHKVVKDDSIVILPKESKEQIQEVQKKGHRPCAL